MGHRSVEMKYYNNLETGRQAKVLTKWSLPPRGRLDNVKADEDIKGSPRYP